VLDVAGQLFEGRHFDGELTGRGQDKMQQSYKEKGRGEVVDEMRSRGFVSDEMRQVSR
jgi:hypothetical protein